MRPRTNKLWSVPKEVLEQIAKDNTSFAGILRALDLSVKGTTNYHRLKRRLLDEGISFGHIKEGLGSNRGRKFGPHPKKIPLDKILIEGSSYCRTWLKARLIASGTLENKCSECGLEPNWNSKPLVMVLDHINGVSDDNRLENLRLVCPNCNSQTATFSGRNKLPDSVTAAHNTLDVGV